MTMPSVKLELHDTLSGSNNGLNFGNGIDDINDVTTKICLTKNQPTTTLTGSLLKGNRRATIAAGAAAVPDSPTTTTTNNPRSKLLKKGSSKKMVPKIRKKTPRRATVAGAAPPADPEEIKSKEELKALEAKIDQLQTLLDQREKVISDQIEKITKSTAKKKEKLDAKRRASNAAAADSMARDKKQSRDLKGGQKEMDDLRASNKSLRNELRKLITDTQTLVAENQNLEASKRDLNVENLRANTMVENKTKQYTKATEVVPQYRERIEECETELEKREFMIASEERIKRIFEICIHKLIEKIQTECNDDDFVSLMEDNFVGLELQS